jgi:hypothetical protein
MTQREFITQDGSFGRSERERLSALIDRLQPALIIADEAEETGSAQL